MHRTLIVFLTAALSGCVTLAPPSSPVATPTLSPSPIVTPFSTASPSATPRIAVEHNQTVQRAINDLAARLTISPNAITVVRVDTIEITIPDTACASDQSLPPNIPAQIIGLEIVLSAGSQNYIYHARGNVVTRCTAGTS